ncbi:MAG: hypothetical protein HN336_04065 [Lentimicrobiaceae bacterium]|jgi:hypothetical protein|nr:hypothetical protein [Lentimicrobiaceae bacterium]MBT3453927.1 hypothetical protein [Lentimicrobiaceae bacterium]MBT3818538.1 hypothetical protein [Lentimicrobiaceae bacterium]MBT4061966.1 hypothetical protein [Lentimicrobiaceae bacterium]MBT4190394.1 hypothetical protein [Lentimicrobiaceae bacterium]
MRNNEISSLKDAVLFVLKYFGLFSYPLTSAEVHRFLSFKCESADVDIVLNKMKKDGHVYKSVEGYYTIDKNPSWSKQRIMGNNRAEDLLRKSVKFVGIIKMFPFVKSIAISGSLSKYYADENCDIDYFIVTSKNRLWISRTLLHIYKKATFLKGHEHYYCMNYFVDETAMEIDQKNIYSAIETVTLIPVYNQSLIRGIKLQNNWLVDYLPNESYKDDTRFIVESKGEKIKGLLESIINIFNGDAINKFFMRVTDKKWRRKWKRKSFPMEIYDEAFHTELNISKNHPANYQSQILSSLNGEGSKLIKEHPACSL